MAAIKRAKENPLKKFLIFLLIFSLGILVGYSYFAKTEKVKLDQQSEKNTPRAFMSESYDKIKENYWDNISDSQLLDQFKSAISQNGGQITTAKFENKDQLLNTLEQDYKGMVDEQKNKFVTSIVSSVLSSLKPANRSALYSQKQEEQLKNTVENINPEKDLYKDLGLAKGASESAVNQAYQKKAEELKNDNSPQSQEKLKQLSYDTHVLTQVDTKVRYDKGGVEPTIFTKIIQPGILYFQFKKFSPTSYDEFIKAFDSYKNDSSLFALIFDLRGNVGGAIDAAPYFLGHFIGKGNYAFDFYHKGDYLPFKTPTDKLPSITKYKQVVVLVDNQTQSSAEIMAGSLKKYHVGVVVGSPTRGWGTVERVFSLDNQISQKEKYSLFLVHSITLGDDNQPIEGKGVEPNINIKDLNWSSQLLLYFNSPSLVDAVREVL